MKKEKPNSINSTRNMNKIVFQKEIHIKNKLLYRLTNPASKFNNKKYQQNCISKGNTYEKQTTVQANPAPKFNNKKY